MPGFRLAFDRPLDKVGELLFCAFFDTELTSNRKKEVCLDKNVVVCDSKSPQGIVDKEGCGSVVAIMKELAYSDLDSGPFSYLGNVISMLPSFDVDFGSSSPSLSLTQTSFLQARGSIAPSRPCPRSLQLRF